MGLTRAVRRFCLQNDSNRRIYEFLAKVLLCVAGTNGINTSWKMVVGQFELTFRQHCHAERTGASRLRAARASLPQFLAGSRDSSWARSPLGMKAAKAPLN